MLLLVLTSWVRNNVVSSNSWNYSWTSNSWHGTVLHYKHMNRLTTCCTAGLLCTLLPLNIFPFSGQTFQGISHQSEVFTYHNQTNFVFSTMLSLQYFLVLEYEHSHLQYSTVCNNITFRMSKERFTCARTASTWKVPATVSSSIVLVWLKTLKLILFGFFFLVLSTIQ